MNWFKKLFSVCEHDWQVFGQGVAETESGYAMTVDLYCPKCEGTRGMFKRDWDYKQNLKSVKQKYESK